MIEQEEAKLYLTVGVWSVQILGGIEKRIEQVMPELKKDNHDIVSVG